MDDKGDTVTFQTLVEGFPELVRIIGLSVPDGRCWLIFLLICKRVKNSVTEQDLIKAPDVFAVPNTTLQIFEKLLPNRTRHGIFREYFVMKGKRLGVKARGEYKMGKRDGYWEEFRRTGKNLFSTHYVDGIEEGEKKIWDSDGVCYEGRVKDGKKVGLWVGRYPNGVMAEQGLFEEETPSDLEKVPGRGPKRWLEYKGLWGRERKVGVWIRYRKDGSVFNTVDFG